MNSVDQRVQLFEELAAVRQTEHRLQRLSPRGRVGSGKCPEGIGDGILELSIRTQPRGETGHGSVPPGREHVLGLEQSHKLVRIDRTHRVVVVLGEAPDPMGKRDEFIPIDLFPASQRVEPLVDRRGQLSIVVLPELLRREACTCRFKFRNEFFGDTFCQVRQASHTRP